MSESVRARAAVAARTAKRDEVNNMIGSLLIYAPLARKKDHRFTGGGMFKPSA
jgi:hypothetical protein